MKKVNIILAILLSAFVLCGCVAKEYSGELSYHSKARDEMFGVEVDAPILIRTVEMVQVSNSEDGTELVLSNKKIDGEENPEFPEGLSSEIFYDSLSLDGIGLSAEVISELAYGDLLEKVELTELPELGDTAYDLILIDNAYVSRGDDYELGDVRITYSYIRPCELKIKGQVKDGVLSTSKIENIQLAEN